ncbi:MAG: ribosome silencing factor [Myxococcota bacterium]|jgi:ribosome-associated protein|nr:ribosome silencing factor [Myxococcota bacterium]HOE81577.1 ribosome silencing factor [Myxococcota bacterium]HON24647.1 ribosome silencing factor [Myxococcota bacterium]HOS62013.1 ribosome silencing factor [Myxococcota bacterium]HPC92163.1 ribosome silencing factor [Myxococcota bacterium]
MEEQLKKIGKRQKPVLPESLQDSKVLALEIVKVAWDRNAYQTKIYDVRKLIDYTDLFVVLSGRSERQVASIADSIQAEMKAAGAIPIGVEGRQSGTWILLDYGSVVVHIFTRDAREYYDLDRLWADAPLVKVQEPQWVLDFARDESYDF